MATVRFVLLLGAATKPALPDNLLVHAHLLLPQVISFQEDCLQYINLENIVRNISTWKMLSATYQLGKYCPQYVKLENVAS